MPTKGQAVFHSGAIFLMNGGTPVRGPVVSDISLDAKGSIKKLMGENSFAEAVGRGSIEISGKFKVNKTNLRFSNAAFFNQELVTGDDAGREMVLDEARKAAASKFTVLGGAKFVQDLGLTNATTGVTYEFTDQANPPAGKYTYNATSGEYTVPAADATADFLVSYMKSAKGQVLQIKNTLAGEAPTFKLIAVNKYQGRTKTIVLHSCVAESFSEAWKAEDFSGQDYSFSVQAHETLGVGEIYTTLQS